MSTIGSISNAVELLDEDDIEDANQIIEHTEIKSPVDQEAEDSERDDLLEKLKVCYPPSIIQKEVMRWANLPIEELRNVVETTISSTGGSFEVAQKIKDLETTYSNITKTEVFQRKVALVEQRGASYIAMVQRIERLAGTDFVTQHLKFTDFMSLVKALVFNIEAVHSTILAIAEEEGLWLPPENVFKKDDMIPIMEGIPADPRVIGYVITALHSQLKCFHGQAVAANDAYRKIDSVAKQLKVDLDRSRDELKASFESKKGLVPFRPNCMDSLYAIRIGGGKNAFFLSLKNPSKKPDYENFDYEGSFETAITLDSVEKARRYIDKFTTKKPKLLKRLGGMTIVEINFNTVE